LMLSLSSARCERRGLRSAVKSRRMGPKSYRFCTKISLRPVLSIAW
jgi:hypothetical protein